MARAAAGVKANRRGPVPTVQILPTEVNPSRRQLLSEVKLALLMVVINLVTPC